VYDTALDEHLGRGIPTATATSLIRALDDLAARRARAG
jgi:hypothetical protein